MKENKSEKSTLDFAMLADIAKALSHPARVEILHILNQKHTCICGEIVDQLPYAQSTVSQHLKELKRVGLINGEIEGPKTCYCLNELVIEKARKAFGSLFAELPTVEQVEEEDEQQGCCGKKAAIKTK